MLKNCDTFCFYFFITLMYYNNISFSLFYYLLLTCSTVMRIFMIMIENVSDDCSSHMVTMVVSMMMTLITILMMVTMVVVVMMMIRMIIIMMMIMIMVNMMMTMCTWSVFTCGVSGNKKNNHRVFYRPSLSDLPFINSDF